MWRVIFSGLIEKSKGATLWKFGDFENNDAGKNPKVQRFYGATGFPSTSRQFVGIMALHGSVNRRKGIIAIAFTSMLLAGPAQISIWRPIHISDASRRSRNDPLPVTN